MVRPRRSILDLVVVLVGVSCCAWPFVAQVGAKETAQHESPVTVDQEVLTVGMLSNPIEPAFRVPLEGSGGGEVSWDAYTSTGRGYKLIVAAADTPAMSSGSRGVEVDDAGDKPRAWRVRGGQRRFGFSVTGSHALKPYSQGSLWRGFDGTTGVEASRSPAGPSASTRTTVKLRTQFERELPTGSTPSTTVTATLAVNL